MIHLKKCVSVFYTQKKHELDLPLLVSLKVLDLAYSRVKSTIAVGVDPIPNASCVVVIFLYDT